MEGVLQEGALYRVLLRLAGERSTGILTVQGEEEIIAFSLLEGRVVAADALNQTLEEALGELLVRRQLVPAEEYGGLAAEYQSGGGRVIDLLVERAYLTREQLLDILREHTYRLCLEAFTWRSGEYRFYQGEEVAYEEGFRAIGVDELSVRASSDLGPSGPLGGGVAGPGAILHRLPGSAAGDDLVGPLRGVISAPEAQKAFAAVDGRRSLEAVAAASGLSLFALQHLVHRWEGEGLVTVSESAPSREPLSEGLSSVALAPEPALELIELDKRTEPPASGRKTREPVRETPWPSRVMGLGLWAAALFLLVAHPSRILLPFPWQGGLSDALEKERRAALHLKIERAATTFFLLNGRFPEELDELEVAHLLTERDLIDPSGRPLVMSSATASYVVEPVARNGSEGPEETAMQASIAGNLLLDPGFRAPEQAGEPPLILLD